MKEFDIREKLHSPFIDTYLRTDESFFGGNSVCEHDIQRSGKLVYTRHYWFLHLSCMYCPMSFLDLVPNRTWSYTSRLSALSPSFYFTSQFVHPWSCSWPAFLISFQAHSLLLTDSNLHSGLPNLHFDLCILPCSEDGWSLEHPFAPFPSISLAFQWWWLLPFCPDHIWGK